jgi:hypothetical protein
MGKTQRMLVPTLGYEMSCSQNKGTLKILYKTEVKGALFFMPLRCWGEVFSLVPWLLLDLTGLNWGILEILEKIQDRQTESWDQVCCTLGWKCPTLIASFLYLDSLRTSSLQFCKTLLKTSFLRLTLSHVLS